MFALGIAGGALPAAFEPSAGCGCGHTARAERTRGDLFARARPLRAERFLSDVHGRGAWGGPDQKTFAAPGTERDDDRQQLRPDHLRPLSFDVHQSRLSAFAASAAAFFSLAGRSSAPPTLKRRTALPFSTKSVALMRFPVK